MIKGIIYDLDDTMVNSHPLHKRAWEEVLKVYGYQFKDVPKEVRANFLGKRVIDNVQPIIDHLNLNISKDELYEKRSEIFLDIVKNELQLLTGLLSSLKLLKENNYKLAVASSGARRYVGLVLEKFNIKKYFDIVITGDDVKLGKPNPEVFLLASEKLGFKPSECLVFEDATNGIMAAKAAGAICIAIENRNVPTQDFSKADFIIHSLNELNLKTIHRFN